MIVRSDLVIGISEARQLLGGDAKDMTDDEIQKLIEDFDVIAQYSIKLVQNFKQKEKKTD